MDDLDDIGDIVDIGYTSSDEGRRQKCICLNVPPVRDSTRQ